MAKLERPILKFLRKAGHTTFDELYRTFRKEYKSEGRKLSGFWNSYVNSVYNLFYDGKITFVCEEYHGKNLSDALRLCEKCEIYLKK
jgi:hypothetical protein